MRPTREYINENSLILMGVPKRFTRVTLKDFDTFNKSSLTHLKDFISDYINNIVDNIENNRGICFTGSNGVGKTMLSCIILREAYKHRYSSQRVTFSSYMSAYTESWGVSKYDERDEIEQGLLEKYKGVEFLVLEEIGKEIDSKIAKPILEDLLRYREEHGLATIICTNLDLKALKEVYGASVCSIIEGNFTVVVIESEDRRFEVFNDVQESKKRGSEAYI